MSVRHAATVAIRRGPRFRCSRSVLAQALRHLVTLHLQPDNQSASHWRGEIVTFLASARRRFSPSIRQRIDLPGLYGDAIAVGLSEGIVTPRSNIGGCPFTLDDLVTAGPDVVVLLGLLALSAVEGEP